MRHGTILSSFILIYNLDNRKKLLVLKHTWTSKTVQSLTSWSLSSMAVAPKSWRF